MITKIKKQSQIKYVSYSQTISRQNYQNYSQNNYSKNYICNGSAHRMHSEWLQAASRRSIWSPRGLGIACSSFEVERRERKKREKGLCVFPNTSVTLWSVFTFLTRRSCALRRDVWRWLRPPSSQEAGCLYSVFLKTFWNATSGHKLCSHNIYVLD